MLSGLDRLPGGESKLTVIRKNIRNFDFLDIQQASIFLSEVPSFTLDLKEIREDLKHGSNNKLNLS